MAKVVMCWLSWLLFYCSVVLQSSPCEGRRAVHKEAKKKAAGSSSTNEEDSSSSSSKSRIRKSNGGGAGSSTSKVVSLEEVLQGKDSSSTEHTAVFDGETLAYVTPWNGAGYDMAKRFRAKLDWVSPVWYQIRSPTKDGVELTGTHDVDMNWLTAVRYGEDGKDSGDDDHGADDGDDDDDVISGESRREEQGTCPADGECHKTDEAAGGGGDGGGGCGSRKKGKRKSTKRTKKKKPLIVPRVVMEMNRAITGLDIPNMADLLVAEAMRVGHDGYVIETHHPMSQLAVELFKAIRVLESGKALKLILVVPAMPTEPGQFEALEPFVDRYSFMTYDYPLGKGGVPNAPLPWMRTIMDHQVRAHAQGTVAAYRTMRRKPGGGSKLLMGLPFYGYDNGEAVVAGSLMDQLSAAEHVEVIWHTEHREHIFKYAPGTHTVSYPTPLFVRERVALASELGVGLAIWELGQGMTYLFDEL